jgi:DnaJ-class molecular chaperone
MDAMKTNEVHRTCSTCRGMGDDTCPTCRGKLYTVHQREEVAPAPGTIAHPKFAWTGSASTNIRERFARLRRELGIPTPAR